MKNKKGFTLVELLAILTLLGILATLVILQTSKTVGKANDAYYKTQEEMMVLSSKDYFLDYPSKLPKQNHQTTKVFLSTLVELSYLTLVKDVNHNACSQEESYVEVVKTNSTSYTYQAHLVCKDGRYVSS